MDWLDPEKNKQKLSDAALFLLAYELLNSSIVDRVKDFFITGFNENGFIYSDNYKNKVLPKAKHVYEASLIWLMESGAIDQFDIKSSLEIREYRNNVAHQIPDFIFSEENKFDPSYIEKAAALVNKIDNFWANIEIDIDPDINNENVDRENAISVKALILKYIISTLSPTN